MKFHSKDNRFVVYEEVLGTGNFSQVLRAVDTHTNTPAAAKVIDILRFKKEFNREVDLLLLLQPNQNTHPPPPEPPFYHPNILRLLGTETIRSGYGVLYLELLHFPSLQSHLQTVGTLPEKVASKILLQLVDAVTYMHSKNVSHHDIKPENISFDPTTHSIKIYDFGLGISMDPNKPPSTDWDAGSPLYMAPEVLLEPNHNPFVADVWSMGLVFYQCLLGKLPFSNPETVEDLARVWRRKKPIKLPAVAPGAKDGECREAFSPRAKGLIVGMLEYDPERRLDVTGVKELLGGMESKPLVGKTEEVRLRNGRRRRLISLSGVIKSKKWMKEEEKAGGESEEVERREKRQEDTPQKKSTSSSWRLDKAQPTRRSVSVQAGGVKPLKRSFK